LVIFQNQNSFIVKQYLNESNSNEYQNFFKQNCHKVELNINIGFAILEILKDLELQKALTEKYDGKNKTVEYIHRLLSVWIENNSSLSNMATVIQKELLKYSKLEDSIETNGFFLLMRLFKTVCEYVTTNFKSNKALILHIDTLYDDMGNLFYIADNYLGKRIQIACHYISFLMQDSDFQAEKLEIFKKYVDNKPTQKSIFIQVINNTDCTLCEDEIGQTGFDKTKQKLWNEIKKLLGLEAN
jgi:hypothetical protein